MVEHRRQPDSEGGQGGRNEEAVVQRNLRETATAAEQYFSNKAIRRLFLGGTAENVAQFREFLSKNITKQIGGHFPDRHDRGRT